MTSRTAPGRLRGNRRAAAFAAVLVFLLCTGSSCESVTTVGSCPATPPGTERPGRETGRASTASVALELNRRYLDTRVRGLTAEPATAAAGMNITSVRLSESAGPGDGRLMIGVRPWLRSDGERAELPYDYTLTLRIAPRLVTPDTVPDPQARREAVGDDQGLLLSFDFVSLYAESGNYLAAELKDGVLVCDSRDFNVVDERLLNGVLERFAAAPPAVAVPATQLLSVVRQLTDRTPRLMDAALGTNSNGLRLGFLLDQGTPDAFETGVLFLSSFEQADWGLEIDTEFVMAKLRKEGGAQLTAGHPAAVLDDISAEMGRSGIDLELRGTVRVCGDFGVTATTTLSPAIRRLPDGRSVLSMPHSEPVRQLHWKNVFQPVCVGFDLLGRWLVNPLGNATLRVGNCLDVMGDPLSFDVGPGERFYATELTTDGIFVIGGRSTAVDEARGARPPVPPC